MNGNPKRTNPEVSQELTEALARVPRRQFLTAVGAVAGGVFLGSSAFAESPVELTKWEGRIRQVTGGVSPFTLQGIASHLGRFTAYGEVELLPAETPGALTGDGVIVFAAADGAQLVGVVSWDQDESGGGRLHHISWRDSVEFNDGNVVFSTGRFENVRPPGAALAEFGLLLATIAVVLIVGISAAPKGSR